ncbi:hypothetical protein Vafri_20084 [Volvox africanus]|uniref:Uncharacterized protein n=1 Tax=Volvox africanus TaxID=51714 RepID=A0A8J4FA32_9CHLO|nr:hypothetical protein Vafri_20084 [Volvox africanus]
MANTPSLNEESRLEELSAEQSAPLLGWLSYRPASAAAAGGPLRPSMRESAVTLALLRRQLARYGGRQAMLLLLVTTGADHNGATVTWQFRCFQARLSSATGVMLLDPLELQTLNLGGHTGQATYQELSAATALASPTAGSQQQAVKHISLSAAVSPVQAGSVAVAVPKPGAGLPQPGVEPTALAALAAGARGQVAALGNHCEALLAGLHELCGQAVAGEATVMALRRRRDALLALLARA